MPRRADMLMVLVHCPVCGAERTVYRQSRHTVTTEAPCHKCACTSANRSRMSARDRIVVDEWEPPKSKEKPRTRECLCCDREFLSTGADNRLCERCGARNAGTSVAFDYIEWRL